jgi:hypothetical protein
MVSEEIRAMSKEIVERTITITEEIKNRENVKEDEVCRRHGVELKNYYRDLKDLRQILSFWGKKIDLIKTKGLLEEPSESKKKRNRAENREDRVMKGLWSGGPPPLGCDVKDGLLVGNKDIENVEKVLRGALKGKSEEELVQDSGFSRGQVWRIKRNAMKYSGYFPLKGQLYKALWKGWITVEEANDIIGNIKPVGAGPMLPGYEWRNGNRMLKPNGKEMYQKMFEMFLNPEGPASFTEIAEFLKKEGYVKRIKGSTVARLLRDRRLTGKILTDDGKLVDSGYEQAISMDTFEAAQKIKVATGPQVMKRIGGKLRGKIMSTTPAFRWELVKLLKVSEQSISHNVEKLKKMKELGLKEDEDGLLRKAWEPRPEKVVLTRSEQESAKRLKILAALQTEDMNISMLARMFDLNERNVHWHMCKMENEGIVHRSPREKGGNWWRISNDWKSPIKAILTRHDVSIEVSFYKKKWLELTRLKNRRRNLWKILQILSKRNADYNEIMKDANVSRDSLIHGLRLLRNEGIIEKQPLTKYGIWCIRKEWKEFIQEKLENQLLHPG